MGHQAAQCAVGTVNWRNMYGAESFLLRPPLFWSQIEAAQRAKQINFEDLERRAREYAEGGRQRGFQKPVENGGALEVPSSSMPKPPQEESDLPPGWATARDAEGKVYYWHRETKAVQWHKPEVSAAADQHDGT
jgi:hypothetical protein